MARHRCRCADPGASVDLVAAWDPAMGENGAVTTSTTSWAAPLAPGLLDATVPVPGSKSVTNRALVLAAQATGPSRIGDPLVSRDTRLMAQALSALGVSVLGVSDEQDATAWTVTPAPLRGPATIDCGL